MNNSTFGQRIKTERLRHGHNQSAFAKMGNVSQTTQAAYESGSRTPDLEYLSQLTEKAGLDPLFIMTGRTQKQNLGNQIDWNLMLEIIATIEFRVESKELVIPIEKKVDLIRVLFIQFSEAGEIDEPLMQVYLRLIGLK